MPGLWKYNSLYLALIFAWQGHKFQALHASLSGKIYDK